MANRLLSRLLGKKSRIVVVELHGVLSTKDGDLNIKSVGPMIEKAFDWLGKKGGDVVLDINSPGGSPVQSALIGDLIRRRAAQTGARVHAVIQDVGASGGYWLACAADAIYANRMSIVGSIGVVGGGFGFTDLIARHGVERRLYTSGNNKARLDPFSPEKPEDVEFIKTLMAETHEIFMRWVRERRQGRLKAAEEALFDGSFWHGEEALKLGLIDGMGDVDALVAKLGSGKARPKTIGKKKPGFLKKLPFLGARAVAEALVEVAEERRFTIQLRH